MSADALSEGQKLLQRAGNEPHFCLRAQDKLAAEAVRFWADEAEVAGVRADKVAGARKIADEMDAWHKHKLPD